jgi:ribosomal protein S18 acetylase RimI-like enzyme
MINHFSIKPVTITDVNKLREICIKTFSETYEHLNTPENFKNYIETHFNTVLLESELLNENSFTYFILCDQSIAGYLKLNINQAQTEEMPDGALEIERIYILGFQQRKGFGEALINEAVRKAGELNKEFVWLGVWEKNEQALRFYEKNGFVKFGTHVFKLGDDNQTDFLYKFTLT